MRTLSSDFQAAANAVQTEEVFLKLLQVHTVENDGTPVSYYYVNNNEPISSNGILYENASFELDLVAESADKAPASTLRFDSGDREIIRKLRELDKTPRFTLSIVMASNPDVIEIAPIEYELKRFQITDTLVSMELTMEPVLDEPIPCDRYTPNLSPGLWGNVTLNSNDPGGPGNPGNPVEPELPAIEYTGSSSVTITAPQGRSIVQVGLRVNPDGTYDYFYTSVNNFTGSYGTAFVNIGRWVSDAYYSEEMGSKYEAGFAKYPAEVTAYSPLTQVVAYSYSTRTPIGIGMVIRERGKPNTAHPRLISINVVQS